jgi:hypothetical protein
MGPRVTNGITPEQQKDYPPHQRVAIDRLLAAVKLQRSCDQTYLLPDCS